MAKIKPVKINVPQPDKVLRIENPDDIAFKIVGIPKVKDCTLIITLIAEGNTYIYHLTEDNYFLTLRKDAKEGLFLDDGEGYGFLPGEKMATFRYRPMGGRVPH